MLYFSFNILFKDKILKVVITILILNQKIKNSWNTANRKHYEAKGYKFTKIRDTFEVNVKDLSPSSHKKVLVYCDYCNIVFKKQFKYIKLNEKDACKQCNYEKVAENNFNNYGVSHSLQRKEVKEKRKQTLLNKYGVDHNMKITEVKEKAQQTNLKRYGNVCSLHGKDIEEKTKKTCLNKYNVDHCLKSADIREKIKQKNLQQHGVEHYSKTNEFKEKFKQTSLEKYGTEHPWQAEEVKQKIKDTNLERYGVECVMQNSNIKEKATITYISNMCKNGKIPTSRYQKHLHNLLNEKTPCELNYQIGRCAVDIAFLDNNIYIEYNGGGHYAYNTIENTRIKDRRRQYYLSNKGWKCITIISIKNRELSDGVIASLINEAKDYLLNSKHSWVEIDIDNMLYKCKCYQKSIEK